MAVVATALRKQMGRQPIADDDILSSLVWVSEMINAVIVGPQEDTTDMDLEALFQIGSDDEPIELIGPHSMDDDE